MLPKPRRSPGTLSAEDATMPSAESRLKVGWSHCSVLLGGNLAQQRSQAQHSVANHLLLQSHPPAPKTVWRTTTLPPCACCSAGPACSTTASTRQPAEYL